MCGPCLLVCYFYFASKLYQSTMKLLLYPHSPAVVIDSLAEANERPVINHPTLCQSYSGASKVRASPCVPGVSHSLAAPSTHPIPSGDHLPDRHRSHSPVRCHTVPAPTCRPDLEWPLSGAPKTMHPAEGPLSHQHDTRRAPTGICAASLLPTHNEPASGTFMDLRSPAQCSRERSLCPRTRVTHHAHRHAHIQCGTIPVHHARRQACATLFRFGIGSELSGQWSDSVFSTPKRGRVPPARYVG